VPITIIGIALFGLGPMSLRKVEEVDGSEPQRP
jgi:hypothetical protein